LPIILVEQRVLDFLLVPTPVVEDMIVVCLFVEATVVLTGQGIPYRTIEVARALQHSAKTQPLVAKLLHGAMRIDPLFLEIRRYTQDTCLEVSYFQRIFAALIQGDACLTLHRLDMTKKMFVPCRQNAHHTQMR